VNNAAGNFISPTKDLTPNGFNAIANTVFHGTFYVTHAVGKRWIAGGHKGSVVSILVTWVWTGSPYVVPSAMSKAGLHVMTKSLAVEWGRYGIRLNAIAPGPFPTEGASRRLRPDGKFEDGNERNPMRRVGQMPELQNLATFLMADGCEWLTGETMALDGAGYSPTAVRSRSSTSYRTRTGSGCGRKSKRRTKKTAPAGCRTHGGRCMTKRKTEPRPAATLLLLRNAAGAEGPGSPEVFMLQRTGKSAFLPGAFVFPGGALDPDDASERAAQRMLGLDDAQASMRLGLASGGLAYWVAAARECFEESGILLAADESGRLVEPERAAALEHLRAPLNEGTLIFSQFLEQEDLYIPAQEIAYYSHWITAPGRPRRFSTRFFVACAPADNMAPTTSPRPCTASG